MRNDKAEKIAESNDRKMATIAKWRASDCPKLSFAGVKDTSNGSFQNGDVGRKERKENRSSVRANEIDRIRSRRTDNKANRPRSVQESAASTTDCTHLSLFN